MLSADFGASPEDDHRNKGNDTMEDSILGVSFDEDDAGGSPQKHRGGGPGGGPGQGQSQSQGLGLGGLLSSSEANEGMWPDYCNPNYIMPDTIEVRVVLPTGGEFYFPVKVVKMAPGATKAYLGGYRNKQSGRIYHHASTQTPPSDNKGRASKRNIENLRTRETQTYEMRSLSVQTYREAGTQMERVDLVVDPRHDVVRVAREYFTAEELNAKKKIDTVTIQRYWRGYRARCRADGIRQRNIEYQRAIREKKELIVAEEKAKRDADMARRLNPRTAADFEVLYNELDAWRKSEISKIKAATAPGDERSAALSALLADETRALQSIQNLKLSAHKEIHDQKTRQMLELMSKPHRWQLSNGDVAQVQTPATKRAKELLEWYAKLTAPWVSIEARLEVLLKVKWLVQEQLKASKQQEQLIRDICDLIDREADLLGRGRSVQSMERLRHRLAHMFLDFVEDPEVNPRSKEFVGLIKGAKN